MVIWWVKEVIENGEEIIVKCKMVGKLRHWECWRNNNKMVIWWAKEIIENGEEIMIKCKMVGKLRHWECWRNNNKMAIWCAKDATGENKGPGSHPKICWPSARIFFELVTFSVACDGRRKTFLWVYSISNASLLKLTTCNR